ncbi:MAG: reverse transcriptase family protein, partial [Candidatus Thiodiazotropha sp.]
MNGFDIIFLGETWLNKNDYINYDIEGYCCDHVFASKSLGTTKGRYSGGISIYYKSVVKDYISVVEKNDYGLLWLKIGSNILKSNVDTYIGYLYAREKNSRIYRHEDVDYFELLEAGIAKYQNMGKVLVSGDFNGRTGTNCDFILYDHYIEAGPDDNIRYNDISLRVNKDHVTDAYGRRLLELCKTTNLLIANGRLGSDKDIGEFTFYGEKGCSVVDYLLVPLIDFEFISYFEICDVTEFSDHAGLSFGLSCKQKSDNNTTISEQTYARKLKWNNDKMADFQNSVSDLSDLFESLSLSIEQDDSENNINDTLRKFSDSLYNCSDRHFGKSIFTENCSKPIKENKWFDEQCHTAKRDFNRAKRLFSHDRSQQNRVNFTKCRSKFNRIKRKAKNKFKRNEGKKISNMAKSNPKAFWKNLKKYTTKNQTGSEKLSANDFFEHFSEVFAADATHNDRNLNSEFQFQSNEILDSEILPNEVKSIIMSLRSNKSPGIDGLISEIFKCSVDLITPFITKLFNTVFKSGLYPQSWTESYITPIFKKGDVDDTNNYRGIALINILAKLYSKLLHDRLMKWASVNEKIIHNQFGFQKNKSTVDCIFIFHSLISKLLSNNEKLFCTFVDYKKAFDTVDRKLLWYKLLRDGCSTTMVNAMKAMYESVKVCVKYKNKYSEFFTSHNGVKQGDPLSPILFIFFINDLVLNLNVGEENCVKINDINVFLLLFADDAVIFSKSPDTLQS